jgi:hypothetical protein
MPKALTPEEKQEKSREKARKAAEKKALQGHRAFARVWNNPNIVTTYDLKNALCRDHRAILRMAESYRQFRKEHPEQRLPELGWRRNRTSGGLIMLPESIMEELEPFRIDENELRQAKGLVVTAAQFGAPLNAHHWKSLKQYAERKGYLLVVLPIKYGRIQVARDALTGDSYLINTFPDELIGHILFEDANLCDGELTLNVMRMRPTLMKHLTAHVKAVGGFATQVFGGPQLALDTLPRVGRKQPKFAMVTGAVTHPNYPNDMLGQQDRTGELAAEAHAYSAIVFEFTGRKTFHFRQLLADKRGHFYDIDPKRGGAIYCTPQGIEHAPNGVCAVVLADWHTQYTDPTVREVTFEDRWGIVKRLRPDHVILHDLVNCSSVSHWAEKHTARRSWVAMNGFDDLNQEMNDVAAELRWMSRCAPNAKIWVVPSNHNEAVTRYIEEHRYVKDPKNLRIGLQMHLEMIEDLQLRQPAQVHARPTDPVIHWLRKACPFVNMLDRQEALILPEGLKEKGILLSLHGDRGLRGQHTRGSDEFRGMNMRVVLGHDHQAYIGGPIWRVGTSTPLSQHYVDNPATNWTNTHCIVYANGQRQLINIVNGQWHGQQVSKLRPNPKKQRKNAEPRPLA